MALPIGLEPIHPSSRLLPTFQIGALPLGLRQLAMTFGLEPKHPYGLLLVFETSALPIRLMSPNYGGAGGIRTHVSFRTNGFQDRLVMATSIPHHIKNAIQQES